MVLSTPEMRLEAAGRFITETPGSMSIANGKAPAVIKPRRMSTPTPSELKDKIDRRRNHAGFVALRERMEKDYALYRLNPYRAGEGYQSFTSNRPRTGADKVLSWLSEARMVIKTPRGSDEGMNAAGNTLEKFLRGSVRINDERLRRKFYPRFQDYNSFSIALRGWYCGRAMFNTKDRYGELYACPEIEPWDPLNMAFDADNDGLMWLGRIHARTPDQILSTFGVTLKSVEEDVRASANCYEYMDREWHCVFNGDGEDGEWLIEPQEHGVQNDFGDPVVPGYCGFQGPVPFIQPVESGDDTWADVGESVFSAIRHVSEVTNKSMSDWMTLVRRAVKHPYVLTSKDGKTTLLTDPFREGGEIKLKEGETIELAPEMKMLADFAAFFGVVNSEFQRGTVPDVVFGDLQFQLSGNAANILRTGARHQVSHRLAAMGDVYREVGNLLRWQYQSGQFGVMRFYGEGEFNHWFDEEIDPEQLMPAGFLEVEFKNTLGFEDPQRFVTAGQLKQSQLAPDDWIASEVLEVEDVEGFMARIKAQNAIQSSPKTLGMDFAKSLLATGKETEAMVIFDEVKRLHKGTLRQDFLQRLQFRIQTRQALAMLAQQDPAAALQLVTEMLQQQVGGFDASQGGGGQPALPAGGGIDNGVMSSQDQGMDTGLRVPMGEDQNARGPGAPRPGARTTEQYAREIGIEIARR